MPTSAQATPVHPDGTYLMNTCTAIKIYSDKTHYIESQRFFLNSIVKALWNNLTFIERLEKYGKWTSLFEYTPDIAEANVCLLPCKWNYYVENHLVGLAAQAVAHAHAAQKPFIIFSEGDFCANLPFQNVILFELAGYRSRKRNYTVCGMPPQVEDLVLRYCSGEVQLRAKPEIPTVGFCGQAAGSSFEFLFRTARNLFTRFSYRAGWQQWEPPPFETTRFRKQIIERFEHDSRVNKNLVLRRKYWAGIQGKNRFTHLARSEFIQNILDSDYTLCMRGGGNFSVRFYEALALGRIPVFFDSDCLLPWSSSLDFTQYFPWIAQSEMPYAVEKLLDFHHSLSNAQFQELQLQCRKLWVDYFSVEGFYFEFYRQFSRL